jgi:hypothetical protein
VSSVRCSGVTVNEKCGGRGKVSRHNRSDLVPTHQTGVKTGERHLCVPAANRHLGRVGSKLIGPATAPSATAGLTAPKPAQEITIVAPASAIRGFLNRQDDFSSCLGDILHTGAMNP